MLNQEFEVSSFRFQASETNRNMKLETRNVNRS